MPNVILGGDEVMRVDPHDEISVLIEETPEETPESSLTPPKHRKVHRKSEVRMPPRSVSGESSLPVADGHHL